MISTLQFDNALNLNYDCVTFSEAEHTSQAVACTIKDGFNNDQHDIVSFVLH